VHNNATSKAAVVDWKFTNATRRRDENGVCCCIKNQYRSRSFVQSKSERLSGAVTIDNNAKSRKNVSFRTKNWMHGCQNSRIAIKLP
jgi:hypothetical protein